VILSPDGGKLSKRKGAASVMDYKKGGFLPEALFNFLALLGWAPGDDREKMTVDELIKAFTINQISPKASVLDEKKLEWMNGLYMAERSALSLAPEIIPLWKEKGWIGETASVNDPYLLQIIDMLKIRSKRTTELAESSSYFFVDPQNYDEKAAKKNFNPEVIDTLKQISEKLADFESFTHDTLENLYKSLAEQKAISSGKLIHPTRLAISGVSFGPGLFELMVVLGKDCVIRRINKAIDFIKNTKSN
jgi:glutamyl-tRNA synthetase